MPTHLGTDPRNRVWPSVCSFDHWNIFKTTASLLWPKYIIITASPRICIQDKSALPCKPKESVLNSLLCCRRWQSQAESCDHVLSTRVMSLSVLGFLEKGLPGKFSGENLAWFVIGVRTIVRMLVRTKKDASSFTLTYLGIEGRRGLDHE